MQTKSAEPGSKQVKVWDPLVRIFHWSLVVAFSVAYLSGEEPEDGSSLHVWAGYAVFCLILIRTVWGITGTPHARFTDFVYRPSVIWAYTRDLFARRARRYLGHNPLGGAMTIALLLSLLATTASGLALYVATDPGLLAGPETRAGQATAHEADKQLRAAQHAGNEREDDEGDSLLEEVHEFFSNFTLLLVFLHIGGVLASSLLHRENLPRAMITGRKRAPEEKAVRP
jgi:cytochrome b